MASHESTSSRRRFLARSAQIALGSAAAFATMGRLQTRRTALSVRNAQNSCCFLGD